MVERSEQASEELCAFRGPIFELHGSFGETTRETSFERLRNMTGENWLSTLPSLSVVIPNYNYEAYVGQAIESALTLRWGDVEVIVVDDGSTDGSLGVIQQYANRITVLTQPNAGQFQACKTGFAASSGSVVIFLDSDDLLHPNLMEEFALVWRSGISKVQVQMKLIDALSKPIGGVLPQYHYVPNAEEVRRWALRIGAYPTPPGSGNVYARQFVRNVFDFNTKFQDRSSDSYLLAAAPILGDVVTIPKPLVSYRIHDRNDGAFSKIDDARFSREVRATRDRFEFSCEVAARSNLRTERKALDRNLRYLSLRLASVVLRPDLHPIPNDYRLKITAKMILAVFQPQGFSFAERLSLALWGIAIGLSPKSAQRALLKWRYVPGSRSQAITNLLVRLRVIK